MADDAVHGSTGVGWRPSGRQIVIIACVVIVALFAALNLDDAKIDFLVASVEIPLVFVIAGCALAGCLAGYLLARHLDKQD